MEKKPGTSYTQKFVCSHNLGQNIWNKVRKPSETGQSQKSLISAFVSFLIAIASLFMEGRLGPRLCLHPNLRFFQYFLIYLDLKSEVVWQFVCKVFYTR